MHKSKLLITCASGVLPILKRELTALNFPIQAERTLGVETEGVFDDTMFLNLYLRTAHRVLIRVKAFRANNKDDLYRELFNIAWEEYIPEDGHLCITSNVYTSSMRDPRFASLKCKDAIVDRIREYRNRRPDTGSERDRTVVHIYWKDSDCSVYLDTSGESLSRRGYRKIPLQAPLQETLAAALILSTGWDGSNSFINPMCGSGTLAIEAALIGLHRPPGLLRSNFGFKHIKCFDEMLWNKLRSKAKSRVQKFLSGKIIATDINPEAVEAARKNAATAGVEHLIEFRVCNYSDTPVPVGGGVVMINPPYGERMGKTQQLEAMYKGLGDFFKKKCLGFTGYVFTSNLSLARKVGLKPRSTFKFHNSGIECKLLEYEIFEGSRKIR